MKRIIKNAIFLLNGLIMASCSGEPQQMKSLVPDTPSNAPDYLCTWNIQGYVENYVNSDMTRKAMNEENLFGLGQYQNWVNFYPQIRGDIYFVMDDSWDIPKDVNIKRNNPYVGSTELNEGRFPSFTGSPSQRLKKLSDHFKKMGWKGLGGWICAQKAEVFSHENEESYWIKRLQDAHKAGITYWKVDWGKNSRNDEWRKTLTRLGKEHAHNLWIEHAMKNEYVEFSDVFRTYDVENIIAQPLTIQRVTDLLPYIAKDDAKGIINCEDEPYIAVGLGCAIGIMRHPFSGTLPNGQQDEVFPPIGHNYKKCIDEVIRAVRWHRIAEPFAVDGNYAADTVKLTDSWELREHETWNKGRNIGSILYESAPASVSRRMPLPYVEDTTANRPFVLATTYLNNAVAVAAIGRAIGREYVTKEVPVSIKALDWDAPIGIFGFFESVTLIYPSVPPTATIKILAQDLAGDTPVDVSDKVRLISNRLTIPKEVINQVGLMNATEGDLSGPGLVVKIVL